MKKQTGFGKGLAMGLVLSALVGTLGVSALAAVSNRKLRINSLGEYPVICLILR